MKLSVLVDNNTIIDRYFWGEPGISFFIEAEGKRILFDVGYSELFIKNAEKMGLNLRNMDYVAISHGHNDHTWGLDHFIKLYSEAKAEQFTYQIPQVVAHPDAFKSKILKGVGEIGSIISEEKLSRHFAINLSEEPCWLTDKLVFLGQIERRNNFENQTPIGKVVVGDKLIDDYLLDDSALAYKSSEGLVIIVGCAHAGICNIIEQAKEVCNEERVVDIIGGFHLLQPTAKQMSGTLDYLNKLQPKAVHACHCTDFNSKLALSQVVKVKEVGVGLRLEY